MVLPMSITIAKPLGVAGVVRTLSIGWIWACCGREDHAACAKLIASTIIYDRM